MLMVIFTLLLALVLVSVWLLLNKIIEVVKSCQNVMGFNNISRHDQQPASHWLHVTVYPGPVLSASKTCVLVTFYALLKIEWVEINKMNVGCRFLHLIR